MKKLLNLSLIIGLLAMCYTTFTACSNDDEHEQGSTTLVNDKRLVKFIYSDGSKTYTYTIDYNSMGQIVRVNTMSPSGSTTSRSYVYEENKITVKEGMSVTVYELSNGRIVSQNQSPKIIDYKYDDQGQLISEGPYKYTWSNGNVVKMSHDENDASYPYAYTVTYSYTNYSSALLPRIVSIGDWVLATQGFLGKRSKNLLSKKVYSSSQKEDIQRHNNSFDYTIEEGVVTKLIEQESSWTNVYTFLWE
ncbi:MAG: hypothetical protein J6W19_07810 [Prevotella sp.]|nr:hypothetical protein [Prevotella sp.]